MWFRGFLFLTFQIDNITRFHCIILMQIIILHQFLPTDIEFLTQETESIAITSYNISYVISYIYLMRISQPGFLLQFLLPITGFTLTHATTVILIKVIILYDCYQSISIRGISCISGFLQTACPTFIICNFQIKQESVTRTPFQKSGVIFIRIPGIAVCTKTFIAGIIIMTHRTSTPVTTAFNAEMIITFACQCTLSGTTFKKPLCQGNTGRYLVFLHLLYGKRSILLYIFHVTGIPALCLGGNGTNQKCQDCSESDSVNSIHISKS